ncbi:hypothetical protein [Streptomyces sp. NPDC088915]|uniref:hypothetical protein n=1 Tax=Streptomyces sp. NPDC088915 TaxID=3365912 RepID=UPI0038204C94
MVEVLDAGVVRAAMNQEPIPGGVAADRISEALGTPNTHGQKAAVTSFVVRRFIARGLLVDLSGNPKGTLHHPGQVTEICTRGNPAELVAADTPLGPDQAADRLRVRRVEFDWMVRLKRIRAAEWAEVEYGTSRAGAALVPLYRTTDIAARSGVSRSMVGAPCVFRSVARPLGCAPVGPGRGGPRRWRTECRWNVT